MNKCINVFFFFKFVCCVTWLHNSAVYGKQLIGIHFLVTGSAWFVKDIVDKLWWKLHWLWHKNL
jgi:hypothetical protein